MSDSWCSGVGSGHISHRLLYLTGQESVPTFRALCVCVQDGKQYLGGERRPQFDTDLQVNDIWSCVCNVLCVVVRLKMYSHWRKGSWMRRRYWLMSCHRDPFAFFSAIHIHWNVKTTVFLWYDFSELNNVLFKVWRSWETQINRHLMIFLILLYQQLSHRHVIITHNMSVFWWTIFFCTAINYKIFIPKAVTTR